MNQTYVVKPGDTLYGISNQFGVSVTELANLNNIQGSFLQVGRVLTIPSKSGINPNNMFMYTVKPGDTIYSIAKKYNTTVQEIMNLNYFTSPNLYVGQVIRIPEMYTKEDEMFLPSFKNYTVKRGDSLYSIARDNNIDINTLMKDNSLTNNNIIIGQVLKIRLPKEDYGDVVEECFGIDSDIPTTQEYQIYTVKPGDNLYSISRKYGVSVDSIIRLNNLSNNNLSINQMLKIPSSQSNVYVVKSGDTLYSIANKYNTTVSNLINKNNLKNNNLSVGQKLII